jgi:5'-deoxynucleotidase YfbR-like HD superfamily hydrolase
VAAHSANVAMIAAFLADTVTPQMLLAALTHDIGEAYTGDVPYPFKHQHPAVKEYLDAAETRFRLENQLNFPVTEGEQQVLKAADMLDLVLKCIDEMEMGNQTVIPMFNTGIEVLKTLILPAGPRAKLDTILEGIGNGWS